MLGAFFEIATAITYYGYFVLQGNNHVLLYYRTTNVLNMRVRAQIRGPREPLLTAPYACITGRATRDERMTERGALAKNSLVGLPIQFQQLYLPLRNRCELPKTSFTWQESHCEIIFNHIKF